jgi:hypothetical protein
MGVKVAVGVSVAVGRAVEVSVGRADKKDIPLWESSWQPEKLIIIRGNKMKPKYRHIRGYYAIGQAKSKV